MTSPVIVTEYLAVSGALETSAGSTFISGRPPWYNEDGELRKPYVVGLAGGTACGKTTVCQNVIDALGLRWVVFLSMDSFYLDLPAGTDPATYNFDSPEAMDWDLMIETLVSLRAGKAVQVPAYDFTTNARGESSPVYGADVILLEGLFALYDERVRELLVGLRSDGLGNWHPFSDAQAAALRETYADDLFWLTAGADGLATLTETSTAPRAGTSWPDGDRRKGHHHDSGQRKLAQSG